MPEGRSTGRLKDPGKPGSMKSIIFASGGGRRALSQWRTERAANVVGAKANKSVAKTGASAAKAVVAGLRQRSKKAPTPPAKRVAKANKTVAKVPKGETLASSYKARMKKMGKI